MRIILTDADSPLGAALQQALRAAHTVVLVRPAEVAVQPDALAGLDVLVHVPALLWTDTAADIATELQQLESGPKQLWSLMQAAQQQGVKRVVYFSSLGVMAGYDHQRCLVTPRWRPRPAAEARVLSFHLSELVLREFVRQYQHQLRAVCLRLDDQALRAQPGRAPALAALGAAAVSEAPGWEHFVVRHV